MADARGNRKVAAKKSRERLQIGFGLSEDREARILPREFVGHRSGLCRGEIADIRRLLADNSLNLPGPGFKSAALLGRIRVSIVDRSDAFDLAALMIEHSLDDMRRNI